MKDNAIDESPTNTYGDLGPDLKPLGWREKWEILKHILKHHSIKIIIVISTIVVLIHLLNAWNQLYPSILFKNSSMPALVSPTSWTDWLNNLQSYIAIGTFFVALFVWYGRIRDDWQNELPKLMSVFFFHKGKPVIVCRHVWLAGAEDLRAWGQQVAAQAVDNDRNLRFGPDVKTQVPNLAIDPDGIVCKHYAVRFRLKELPNSLKGDLGKCRYQNFASIDKEPHSIESDQVEALPAVTDWREPIED